MNNIQKKLICIGLTIIIIVILLAGCGQNTDQDTNSDPAISTGENAPSEGRTSDDLNTPNTDDDTDYIDQTVQETDTSMPKQESLEEKAKAALETLEVWDGSVAESFDGGDGSAENPYQITDGAQLAKLANDVNNGVDFSGQHFVLTSDIMLNGINQWNWDSATDSSLLDTNNNWNPIGINYFFNGNFDGQNHIIWGIYNAYTYRDNYGDIGGNVGLFGTLNNGTISNLSVACGILNSGSENVGTIVGEITQGSVHSCHILHVNIVPQTAKAIGGICGTFRSNDGIEIVDCSSDALIEYTNASQQGLYVGGIVGDGLAYENSGLISACYSECTLMISNTIISPQEEYPAYIYAGGICGAGDIIVNCCSMGNIGVTANCQTSENFEGFLSVNIGGIIGWSSGPVLNCSSSNNLQYQGDIANTYMGGIAGVLGRNDRSADGFGHWYKADVTFCYSNAIMEDASTEAVENIGGISGCAGGEVTVTNCYYNKEYSDRAIAHTVPESKVFTDQIKGLSTEDLSHSDNYYNWDFESTWTVDDAINNGLPILRVLSPYYKDYATS